MEKRRKKKGLLQTLINGFLGIYLKVQYSRLHKKLRDYETQKHLEKVVDKYISRMNKEIHPHRNWFYIFIPQIEINIVKIELLSLSDAYQTYDAHEKVLKDLIAKKDISIYRIENKEFIRRSEIEKILQR